MNIKKKKPKEITFVLFVLLYDQQIECIVNVRTVQHYNNKQFLYVLLLSLQLTNLQYVRVRQLQL